MTIMEEIANEYIKQGRARGATDEQLLKLEGFEEFAKAQIELLNSITLKDLKENLTGSKNERF